MPDSVPQTQQGKCTHGLLTKELPEQDQYNVIQACSILFTSVRTKGNQVLTVIINILSQTFEGTQGRTTNIKGQLRGHMETYYCRQFLRYIHVWME